MTRKSGFSLVEVLICIAIIAIVAGVLTPVFRMVKHAAQITESLSNLHQMSVALALYQSANGGSGSYGSLADMDLPNAEQVVTSRLGLPLNLWRSPCGQNPSWDPVPIVIQYVYFPAVEENKFAALSPKYEDNLTMFADWNCAEPGEPLYSDYVPHRVLGVLLSGSLRDLNKPGDSRQQSWWSNPDSN